jgi:hypothetical protein
LFTGGTATQNELRDVRVVAMGAEWLVLLVSHAVHTDELLFDLAPADMTLRLE